MYIIFDTETTTFPRKDIPYNHPEQARVIQLAWVVLDEHFKETACFKSLIKSGGNWQISAGAFSAHGIQQSDCDKYGLPMEDVIGLFTSAMSQQKLKIAHNIRFDQQLINTEVSHYLGDYKIDWNTGAVCTMELMTPICKIQHKTRTGFKWPKLQEAYKYCFGEEFKGAHDALSDVRATAAVFKWLVENRHVNI